MQRLVVVLLLFIASTAWAEIYTWKDARGTVFYTNSLHEIPARYRSRAKLLDVATGKKSAITATPAGGQTGPGAAPGQQAPAVAPAQEPRAQLAPPQPAPAATPAPASTPSAIPAARGATGAETPSRLTRAQRRAQQRQNRTGAGSQDE